MGIHDIFQCLPEIALAVALISGSVGLALVGTAYWQKLQADRTLALLYAKRTRANAISVGASSRGETHKVVSEIALSSLPRIPGLQSLVWDDTLLPLDVHSERSSETGDDAPANASGPEENGDLSELEAFPDAQEDGALSPPQSENEDAASAFEQPIAALRTGEIPGAAPQPERRAQQEPPPVELEIELRDAVWGEESKSTSGEVVEASECQDLCLASLRPIFRDLVDASVFAPKAIAVGGEALVQVFLHKLHQKPTVYSLAMETDPNAGSKGVHTLAVEVERGQHIEIALEGRRLNVDQAVQTVVWRGDPCACQFTVTAPKDLAGHTFHPRAVVLIDGVPAGSVTFALTAETKRTNTDIELRGDRARRYNYAFLSYASADRFEVLRRAQMLRLTGIGFFHDLLSLEPGECWEKQLYEEIDRCDVFYLFWSSQAKASEWVLKETEYALARRACSAEGDPDIIPVIIEGPPPPTPPESLKDIQFNDWMLYVLAGEQRGASAEH